jgi:hypothetical protein
MALYIYNITGAPVVLAAGHPVRTIPRSAAAPTRGPAVDCTSELRPDLTVDPINGVAGGLLGADYVLLQGQAASLVFEWTSDTEFLTPGLTVPTPGGSDVAAHAALLTGVHGLDVLSVVTKTRHVDGNRVDVYAEDGSIVRPHKSIQAAVDAIAALAEASYHVVSIASGIYAENVVLEDAGLQYIKLQGDGYVSINPAAGNALQSTASNDGLKALLVSNIGFAKPVVIAGAAGAPGFNDVIWDRPRFTAAATLSVSCVNNFSMVDPYSECNISYVNVGWSYIESGQLQGQFNLTMDDTQPVPSSGNAGTLLVNGVFQSGAVSYTIGGTAAYTVATQACRWGAAGPSTVPAGLSLLAYDSWVRGTLTNNGSITLRNSATEGYVAGTGTLTITGNPGTQVFFAPAGSAGLGHWVGADPANLNEAVDRLAVALVARTGAVPIP